MRRKSDRQTPQPGRGHHSDDFSDDWLEEYQLPDEQPVRDNKRKKEAWERGNDDDERKRNYKGPKGRTLRWKLQPATKGLREGPKQDEPKPDPWKSLSPWSDWSVDPHGYCD